MKQALGGATKDMGKMLGGDEEKDPDAAKKEEERQEALRQAVTKTPWLSVPMLTSTIWICSSSRIRSTTLF